MLHCVLNGRFCSAQLRCAPATRCSLLDSPLRVTDLGGCVVLVFGWTTEMLQVATYGFWACEPVTGDYWDIIMAEERNIVCITSIPGCSSEA
ncbi:hypothetical protein N658DRAFT_195588 [Parathielavia hyrcaniae]|uniref:Uncharacterized protein n=1 Tax=Parathielavia hyrcaniae TaxID=113614 RepID=A0AAN6T4Y2_9PEZI|nr:hypothetical protein N658DRAFT_195588 [Parathielavia hyrcaniae]